MKKRSITFLTVFLMMVMAFPAVAAYQDMQAQVYKWTGGYNQDGSPGLTLLTTGVTYKVLATGSTTAETIYKYNDKAFTAKTNPVTATVFATDDAVQFRVDPTDTTYDRYVDLIVVDTNGGYTAFVKDFDKYTHTIVIDERPNVLHHGVMWFSASTTNAYDSTVDFLKGTNIRSVALEVITPLSGQTIRVGTSSTANAFLDYELLTTAGIVYTTTSSAGSVMKSASVFGGAASYMMLPFGYVLTADTDLYYTVSSTTGTPDGYIHYWFSQGRF